jgi:hypothetical protein
VHLAQRSAFSDLSATRFVISLPHHRFDAEPERADDAAANRRDDSFERVALDLLGALAPAAQLIESEHNSLWSRSSSPNDTNTSRHGLVYNLLDLVSRNNDPSLTQLGRVERLGVGNVFWRGAITLPSTGFLVRCYAEMILTAR